MEKRVGYARLLWKELFIYTEYSESVADLTGKDLRVQDGRELDTTLHYKQEGLVAEAPSQSHLARGSQMVARAVEMSRSVGSKQLEFLALPTRLRCNLSPHRKRIATVGAALHLSQCCATPALTTTVEDIPRQTAQTLCH